MRLADVNVAVESNCRVLVYGASKSGKTFGAGTWPRPNFLDFDGGIRTLLGKDFVALHGYRADIMVGTFVETTRGKGGVVTQPTAFDNACRYFDECMKPSGKWDGKEVGRSMFDTWVIDTCTSLSEAAMNKAIWLLQGRMRGVKSETLDEALRHGVVVPKLQDYGAERSMVEQFVDMVLSTDKHVVVLCHQKEVTDDTGVLIQTVPLLTGKGVESICLRFDDVWHVRPVPKGTTVRYVLTTDPFAEPSLKLKVGSRLGVPSGIEWSWNAVYPEIQKVVQLATRKEQ